MANGSDVVECLTMAEPGLTGGGAPQVAPFAEFRQLGALLQRAGLQATADTAGCEN